MSSRGSSAFLTDPVVSFLFPDPRTRAARYGRLVAAILRTTRGRRRALRTTGAAALWLPPEQHHLTVPDIARLAPTATIAMRTTRLIRALPALDAVDRAHPKEPHWYLFLLGSTPAARGGGHGRAVVDPVLAECDEQGLPAYLESSNPDNVPYYARLGFELRGEAISRHGTPPLIPMWREPR